MYVDVKLWISSNFNFLCRTPQWWLFFWAFLRPAKPVKPASSKHGKQRMAFRRLVVRAACWMMSTPQYSQRKWHDFPSMEHAAHNEFGSPCQIASHNSMSRKKKERTLNPFFFKMLLVWGLFQKKHHGPNGSQTTGFAGFGLTAHQLGNGDTFLSTPTWSTFIFGASLRPRMFKVFGPKELGQGLNLDSFCYAAWKAALCFFTEEWFGMIFVFFNEVSELKSKKKNTCLQKIHPLLHLVGFLPNQLENLKWKLLNSKEPTFLPNHPPRNDHVSHLGKSSAKYSKIIFKSTGC